MKHSVALAFEDGVTRFITCDEDQSIADASYRQRINIPVDCNDGACGTCRAFCESGDVELGSYVEDALSDEDAQAGFCLPCQARPRSDLVLQIASTSEVARTAAATYEATVTEVVRHSESTMAFSVTTPARDSLAFLPGQYVNITVPGTQEVRSYSFSTDPGSPTLSFLVKVVPGGAMSTWLAERAQVGDTLSFSGPHGSFFLRDAQRPAVLVAGGTGLAPILSMLRHAAAQGSKRDFRLVYGVNTDADAVELGTLRELEGRLPGLSWDYCVADEASSAEHVGYVMSILDDADLHSGDVAIYLCGPPPMVEAVREDVAGRGITPTGFYFEKFSSAGAVAAKAAGPAAAQVQEGEVVSAVEAEESPRLAEAVAQAPTDPAGAVPPSPAPVSHAKAQPWVGVDDPEQMRGIAGQRVFASAGPAPGEVRAGAPADDPDQMRGVRGQDVFVGRDPRSLDTAPDGYEIGEEHAPLSQSNAIFEARQALELGALDLVVGRLDDAQVEEYRRLALATVPHVRGDRFVDAHAYTQTNAAFHEHLFALTGNDHLRQAYERLGVTAHMDEALREATWCHPLCTKDHLDIVDAVGAGDRVRARELVTAHATRSTETTRRAMAEQAERRRPRHVSPGRFAGKVVLVTGAAQGIGEAVARRVHAEGGQLVLVDRSEVVDELGRELASQDGAAPQVEHADLETYAGAEAVVAAATARHGRVDVAIHNVGGAICFKPFEEFTPEQVDAEITRSLMTTLYGCRAVLPGMLERGGGTIVNISSIATGGIYRVPYAAAKGGVNAITRSLAVEAAPRGVRVLAAAPGGTSAPPRRVARGAAPQGAQEQEWFEAHVEQTLDSALMSRYGTLEEQAAVICFLASDEASYMTGQVVPVGGGDLG